MCKLDEDHVDDRYSIIIFKIPDIKTQIQRAFTITNDNLTIELFSYARKYRQLHQENVFSSLFFVKYVSDKCYNQNVEGSTQLDDFQSV